jgi:hypothetical protein
MCQSIQTVYKFCECPGEFYRQRCPKPSATCHILLANPTDLQLTCYCEAHSSQTFKTIRQDQRDTARVNKEYGKVLAREERKTKKVGATGLGSGSTLAEPVAQGAKEKDFSEERIESLQEGQKSTAAEKLDEAKMKAAQKKEMIRRARGKIPGVRQKSDRKCIVM